MREMAAAGEFAPKLPRRTPVVGHRPRIPATVELLREACERFSKGETLSAICLDAHMPDRTCLWRFTLTDPQYEQLWGAAKAMHAEHLMDQTGPIADREVIGPDGRHDSGAVPRDKLRIEQRHMRAAALDPARWGPEDRANHCWRRGSASRDEDDARAGRGDVRHSCASGRQRAGHGLADR
jgi:hypothetical protein